MIDWNINTIIASLALVLAGLTFYDRLGGKLVTRFEYDEFKKGLEGRLRDIHEHIKRIDEALWRLQEWVRENGKDE